MFESVIGAALISGCVWLAFTAAWFRGERNAARDQLSASIAAMGEMRGDIDRARKAHSRADAELSGAWDAFDRSVAECSAERKAKLSAILRASMMRERAHEAESLVGYAMRIGLATCEGLREEVKQKRDAYALASDDRARLLTVARAYIDRAEGWLKRGEACLCKACRGPDEGMECERWTELRHEVERVESALGIPPKWAQTTKVVDHRGRVIGQTAPMRVGPPALGEEGHVLTRVRVDPPGHTCEPTSSSKAGAALHRLTTQTCKACQREREVRS